MDGLVKQGVETYYLLGTAGGVSEACGLGAHLKW